MFKKYAELAVGMGVNLEAGQHLIVNAPIEAAELVRSIAETAYQKGARDVTVCWQDEKIAKLRYVYAADETLAQFPAWRRDLYLGYAKQNAAVISIAGNDPDLMTDVDPARVMIAQKAAGEALLEYRARLMNNQNAWTIIPFATSAWAKKVFPQDDEAAEKLWRAIYAAVRLNGESDPVAAWNEHTESLRRATDFMNRHSFRSLHYKNNLGTDLTVELPEGHIWAGGAEYTAKGRRFVANIPTEEVYTLPRRDGINGVVCATKPLIYQGQPIRDFSLRFQKGKVTEFSAKVGRDILKNLLSVDEGASFLGEVALVPHNSPISESGILFYNTLFDENASCHLALGKAYPTCIKGGDVMDSTELARHGVNDSLIHVDFMIGSSDLSIVGIDRNGAEVSVFKDGNFDFT